MSTFRIHNTMSSRIRSHVSSKVNILVWILPVCGLLVVTALFVFFVSKGSVRISQSVYQGEIIKSEEPFSGEVYANTEFEGTIFSDLIVSLIDQATTRIEIAVYSMNHPRIHDALYRASDRGVLVTLLLSASRSQTHSIVFSDFPDQITRIEYDPQRGYMHHKFLIVDRGLSNEVLVFGSYNFTELQERYDASFVLKTTDTQIISIFGREFDRLVRNVGTSTTHLSDSMPSMTRIEYPEGDLEIWFSPPVSLGTGIRERVLNLITHATERIRVMMWSITDTHVARALVSAARAGKRVEILTDDSTMFNTHSVIPDLHEEKETHTLNMFEIFTDAKRTEEVSPDMDTGFNPFLHHHTTIIDSRIVLFGTSNWSANGFYYNNEATMISTIPYLISSFEHIFEDNMARSK